jgi:glucosamine--fructose-6-phosphate aminotransferase (isomerizing)
MTGELMRTEMSEQPRVLAHLLSRREETVGAIRGLAPAGLQGVILVARGSSDNAALHARYLMELATGRPVVLAAPSLWTRYGVRARLEGWVAVAVSQSGRTPEIVDTLTRMRDAGARTVAVTNGEATELATAAQVTVFLGAGPENAVPATKTATSSMLALTHVAAGLGRLPWQPEAEQQLPDHVAAVLADVAAADVALDVLGECETVHVGRGFTLAVALEAALKVKETSRRPAHGYASGDFLHGPVTAVGAGSAVLTYAAEGPTFDDVLAVTREMRARGVPTVLVSDAPGGVGVPRIAVPGGSPEALAAVLLTVRAQQVAYALSVRGGLDPDHPAGLSKVTATT